MVKRNLISKKKVTFKISESLRDYLLDYGRETPTIDYQDLLRYSGYIALINDKGEDTLWKTVFYNQSEINELHQKLKQVYSDLSAHGDAGIIDHLYIDRIDICPFANSEPFRIRIVNHINDNFDYFYVKKADDSRIYGLELEHHLSPNRINYLVEKNTLVEEHIAGVPGDMFINSYMNNPNLNKVRIAKEFVKFNERCFVRLLGDMHANNFVVNITPDFEEMHYRIRAIDFDQQSYEGSKEVYLPKFFNQNAAYVELGNQVMTPESVHQYQLEERSLIKHRIRSSKEPLGSLLDVMVEDKLSLDTHLNQLRQELANHYNQELYTKCKSMGEIVKLNLDLLSEE
jgi:hypothetical protein